MFTEALKAETRTLLERYRQVSLKLAVAESCTGGLLSALLTEIPGASEIFERGFVTYSNDAKTESLDVSAKLIKKHGAVSKEVARAMALGALEKSAANIAVAITGIAGPDGGTPEKPVGLVYIAVAADDDLTIEEHFFEGDRSAVRKSAVLRALEMLNVFIDS